MRASLAPGGAAAPLPAALRRAVLRIFTEEHGYFLQSDAVAFIHEAFVSHALLEEEWGEALEALAKGLDDEDAAHAGDVVTRARLQAQYERLVVEGERGSKGQRDLVRGEVPDPEAHFAVIDAFHMPRWTWRSNRGWEALPPPTLLPTAAAKPQHVAARLALLRSIVLRNENFLPPLVAGVGGKQERAAYMKLTSTKNLLGRQGQRFLIFGRLGTSEDGRYVLEDADGVVGLDLEDAIPGEGIFTEGAFVLIEGEYTEEERIRVFVLGHPPSETRDTARQICSQIDFLGSGAIPLSDEPLLKTHEAAHDNLAMVFVSELHLDHAKSLASFRAMLQGYADADFIPFAFVLCGSFSAEPHKPGALARYQDAFTALGELLLAFPDILAASHFVFVPSSADPFSTSLLPRQPLPDLIADRLRSKVGPAAAARMHFTSNPTRLVYFSQEIVVSRDDTMTRMLRNAVRLKDEVADGDLKKFLVSTILDQVHLHPLPQSARPVLWEHDHALRLYPMPTVLVLADKYDRFHLTYEGCHVFNPSSFRGASFGWTTYYPSTRVAEGSELPQ